MRSYLHWVRNRIYSKQGLKAVKMLDLSIVYMHAYICFQEHVRDILRVLAVQKQFSVSFTTIRHVKNQITGIATL